MRVLYVLLSLMMSSQVWALDASIRFDRTMGLLIGDSITATVTLPVDVEAIDLHSLPAHEKRQGPWLILHDRKLLENMLVMHFQIINVPAENRTIETPLMQLRTLDGAFINVPPALLQIGSFLEKKEGGHLPRGDAPLPATDNDALYQQLWISLAVWLLVVGVATAWHYGFRPHERLPFAAALHELNKLRWLRKLDDDKVSRVLHQAFNRSADRVVIHSQLNYLWQQCPWLTPLKTEIEAFYLQSAAHYFSPSASAAPTYTNMRQLAKACRALEKMA
jgi:mxaA protein